MHVYVSLRVDERRHASVSSYCLLIACTYITTHTQMLCGSCDVGFGIHLDHFYAHNMLQCYYEPEIFAGVTYEIKDLKVHDSDACLCTTGYL